MFPTPRLPPSPAPSSYPNPRIVVRVLRAYSTRREGKSAGGAAGHNDTFTASSLGPNIRGLREDTGIFRFYYSRPPWCDVLNIPSGSGDRSHRPQRF